MIYYYSGAMYGPCTAVVQQAYALRGNSADPTTGSKEAGPPRELTERLARGSSAPPNRRRIARVLPRHGRSAASYGALRGPCSVDRGVAERGSRLRGPSSRPSDAVNEG